MPENAVRVSIAPDGARGLSRKRSSSRVLYEDESLIAIDKPPGMVVHPTYRNWSGTLLNGLLWHVRGRAGVQPSIVTRLDKDTSGSCSWR